MRLEGGLCTSLARVDGVLGCGSTCLISVSFSNEVLLQFTPMWYAANFRQQWLGLALCADRDDTQICTSGRFLDVKTQYDERLLMALAKDFCCFSVGG